MDWEENPGLVSLYTIRGNAYLQLNDLDHALADFSSAIKTNPGFSCSLLLSRPGICPA